MKKAQQMITDESLLAAYLSADSISLLQSCFMKIYDFENILNPQTASLLDAFRQKSHDQYILKPQREGGGNNLTGLEAIQFLEKLEKEGNLATILKGYILMEKIESPTQSNNLMRQNNVLSSQSIGELGIFGTIL